MKAILGDPHNFNKKVHLNADGRVEKPRCVYWEWSLLARASPIRGIFTECVGENLFSTFPDLEYDFLDDGLHAGTVSYLDVNSEEQLILSKITPEHMLSLGTSVGLLTWLGCGDLHRENIVFGFDKLGKFIFTPIDIEILFENYLLPFQTHLLPSQNVAYEACGLYKVFNSIHATQNFDLLIALVCGYKNGIMAINSKRKLIYSKLIEIEHLLKKVPIRFIPRPTAYYKSILDGLAEHKATPDKLDSSEAAQLARQDIPFYFYTMNAETIFYYINPGKLATVNFANDPTVNFAAANFASIERKAFENENNSQSYKAGILQIIKTYATAFQLTKCEFGWQNNTIKIDTNYITVTINNEIFQTNR